MLHEKSTDLKYHFFICVKELILKYGDYLVDEVVRSCDNKIGSIYADETSGFILNAINEYYNTSNVITSFELDNVNKLYVKRLCAELNLAGLKAFYVTLLKDDSKACILVINARYLNIVY